MITVILRNRKTGEEICRFPYVNKKRRDETLRNAIREISRLQETEDILKLGRTCRLKDGKLGLGIGKIYTNSKECVESTLPMETVDSVTSQKDDFVSVCTGHIRDEDLAYEEPEELMDGEGNSLGITIQAESYACGLVLNTGRTMQCGIFGMGGTQPAYFEKFTSSKVYSNSKDRCKLYESPSKLLKAMKQKLDIFKNLVDSDFQYSVEYVTAQFEQEIMSLPENKKKKWDKDMEELRNFLEELNQKEKTIHYATDAAKAVAEWEMTQKGDQPPRLSEEDLKAEAIFRMKEMGLWDKIINTFSANGKMFQHESYGIIYDLDKDARDAVEKVRGLGLYPYLVIKTETMDGNMYDVLFVSENPAEWEFERCDKDGCLTSCCVSDLNFGDTEIGEIKIRTIHSTGGLVREG